MMLVHCFIQCALNAQGTSGPTYIKNLLTEEGVFNIPSFDFTTDYDQYREHDNIQGLLIDALDFNGHTTKVFCWYGIPEGLAPGEKAPAVVVVHGGGGTAFPGWVKEWTDRGYIAIAIAHEGQRPGPKDPWFPTTEFSGPRRAGFFRDGDNNVKDQWFYHAVADVILANSFLRNRPEVDINNIGVNGISWGGILTNVVTGIDDRFKFFIPVYGCGFLYESPHYIKDIATNNDAENEFYMNNWDPSLYIPLQNVPTFYVNGNNDKQFSMNVATPSYKLMPSEKYLRIEDRMTHSTVAGYTPEEIYSFADYITENGTAPMTVDITDVTENTVTASYTGNAQSAVLFYTTFVADWSQNSYDWEEAGVQLNTNTKEIIADLPENTKYYYINVTSDEDFMYSSPMEKVEEEINAEIYATDVVIQATENTTYPSGEVTMTGIGTIAGTDGTFEVHITVTPSVDVTAYPNAAIVSGISDNNQTSSSRSWGISDDGTNDAVGDRVFVGDQQFTATISNARIGAITGTSGLTADDITIDTFKSIKISNGNHAGDRFTFSADGSSDFELGRFTNEPTKDVDLVVEASDQEINSFTIKNGSTATNNKWAVDNIKVQVTINTTNTLSNNEFEKDDEALILFPNPAKDKIALNITSKEIQIFDLTGKRIKVIKEGKKEFNISDLNTGLYIIKVETEKGNIIFKKFLKTK